MTVRDCRWAELRLSTIDITSWLENQSHFHFPFWYRWLRQNSFSSIILSWVILQAAYRRKQVAQAATSLDSNLVKVTFSLKKG